VLMTYPSGFTNPSGAVSHIVDFDLYETGTYNGLLSSYYSDASTISP